MYGEIKERAVFGEDLHLTACKKDTIVKNTKNSVILTAWSPRAKLNAQYLTWIPFYNSLCGFKRILGLCC